MSNESKDSLSQATPQQDLDASPEAGSAALRALGVPEQSFAKLDFATAADCVRNLYEEFRHAKKTTGSATLSLRSAEMEALRSVSISCRAAKSALAAHEALVKALREIEEWCNRDDGHGEGYAMDGYGAEIARKALGLVASEGRS